jgi:hypothetical protein
MRSAPSAHPCGKCPKKPAKGGAPFRRVKERHETDVHARLHVIRDGLVGNRQGVLNVDQAEDGRSMQS